MKKIFVALSGGVDSAVTALILKQKGCFLISGIMTFPGIQKTSIESAHAVARHLDIPFYVFDVTEEFTDCIVNNVISEYSRGRTPNPCVSCNENMKFGLLRQKAREQGAEFIATGHYARIEKPRSRYILKRGVDKNEQSYFLYRLNQQQLSSTLLPLGKFTKQRVRNLADKHNVPVARRKKSQDICIVPRGNFGAFLKKHIPEKPGPIVNEHGKTIGMHRGVVFYTRGQRRGIGVSRAQPRYVTGVDVKNNTLYVGKRDDVYSSDLLAEHLTFIPFEKLSCCIEVKAKIRYVARRSQALVEPLGPDRVKVRFKRRQWAVTPGQSVVFYDGDVVLGGGIISSLNIP